MSVTLACVKGLLMRPQHRNQDAISNQDANQDKKYVSQSVKHPDKCMVTYAHARVTS